MTLKTKLLLGKSIRSHIMRASWNEGECAVNTYKKKLSDRVEPGMRILHVGCGWDKRNVTRPHKGTCDVVGIDLDPQVASLYHAPFVLGSVSQMAFKDDSFDLIVSEFVLEHIDEPATAFQEMARVLKPRGRLLILTPNLYSYKSLIALFAPHKFHILMGNIRYGPGHDADMYPTLYKCNTSSRLIRASLAHGLQNPRVQFVTNGPTWFENFPILFEVFHVFHLMIARFELARQLRCALILEALKEPQE